jgi:hypothetical protein
MNIFPFSTERGETMSDLHKRAGESPMSIWRGEEISGPHVSTWRTTCLLYKGRVEDIFSIYKETAFNKHNNNTSPYIQGEENLSFLYRETEEMQYSI